MNNDFSNNNDQDINEEASVATNDTNEESSVAANNTKEDVPASGEDAALDKESKKKKALYITNIVVNSIFYAFIFILLLFSISQIAGSKNGKVKNVFGLGYEVVASNSMSPTFDAGDLIWVNTSFKASKLKIGDVVTFWDTVSENPTSNTEGFLNTHRIVDFVYATDGSISAYVLQGDIYKGTAEDYNSLTDAEKALAIYTYQYTSGPIQIVQSSSDIKAVYIGHWSGAGNFINWLSNPKKGFVIVVLFTGAFLIFEMFMVIKNIMDIKTAKMSANQEAEKEEMKKSLEEEREKMKAELLAQLRAEQEAAAKENAETKTDEEESTTEDSSDKDEE
ncbi:MAG: hypothetical protein K6G48_03750 [Acholeplasmatales bacterium]|nr:hypothetical protein [Acholeplasmatales bacterium]